MLLLLTSSRDLTVDLLIEHFSTPVFRFNLDIFEEYELQLTPEAWSISNPAGLTISSTSATRCLWWKVVLALADEEQYVRSEIRYIARELYAWFWNRGLAVGNSPEAEDNLGKVTQASIANRHFKVPKQIVTWGNSLQQLGDAPRNWVAKSLSSQLVTPGRALFTTEVDPNQLDARFPWYVQELIRSPRDVTLLFVGGKTFAFSRERSSDSNLDWRVDAFGTANIWKWYQLNENQIKATQAMMRDMRLTWGRIDFLEANSGLYFLEVNPNGQWAFLDPDNRYGLVTEVANHFETAPTHGLTSIPDSEINGLLNQGSKSSSGK